MDLHQQARSFVLRWIQTRHGSAADLLVDIERDLGWPARLMVGTVIESLRNDSTIGNEDHKFIVHTLNAQALAHAMSRQSDGVTEHQSALDDLFARTAKFRRSKKFAESVEFIAKFRDYSPFNNTLIYLQNPFATYVATASQWFKNFRRNIKEDARPIIILAPRTPVLLLYDVADTEGPPLPAKLETFSKVSGRFDPAVLQRTLINCAREKIQVERKDLPALRAGLATMRVREPQWNARVVLRTDLDDPAAYGALCHELGHIFLGHVGANKKCNWPNRTKVSHAVAEIEAEAVAYIVCKRAGLKTGSPEYLSTFLEDSSEVENVSVDLICRVAGRIEGMGHRSLKPRSE